MANLTIREKMFCYALNRVISYIDKNPDENILKIIRWLKNHDKEGGLKYQINAVYETLSNPNNNWTKLVKSLWDDIDTDVRKTIFCNVVVNGSMLGSPKQRRLAKELQCNVPWAILMDPTTNCNLHCTGCWAGDYKKGLNLSLEELNDVVSQGKEVGVYTYVLSGGEPLIRKDDIIKLCEKNQDCAFLAFTNGTLIDEAFSKEMLRVKNFVPAISLEGFKEENDKRRGEGTYDKIIDAIKILKEHKLLFGVSCCYTKDNALVLGSEAFMDHIINLGAKFCWYFTYIPVGVNAPVNLIADSSQREYMYHQIRAFRSTKPIFTMDFWNDGEYVAGCIAGGRHYLHINANGDYEPCAFIHYSDSNIREKTLLEALQSPLFQQYRAHQPFNRNLLRPCPLLDNPDYLAMMVDNANAYSTDLNEPEDVPSLVSKTQEASLNWAHVPLRLRNASRRSRMPPRDDIKEQMDALPH
ncbi:MAG: radical SAM protein [Clostridiales bacterium]|nr:radical SAM protein [Clostridiales bacterium]